jgi:hypothetical protein
MVISTNAHSVRRGSVRREEEGIIVELKKYTTRAESTSFP